MVFYYPVDVEPYTPSHHFEGGKGDPASRTKLKIASHLVEQAMGRGISFRAGWPVCHSYVRTFLWTTSQNALHERGYNDSLEVATLLQHLGAIAHYSLRTLRIVSVLRTPWSYYLRRYYASPFA
jgi:hypothetical protein